MEPHRVAYGASDGFGVYAQVHNALGFAYFNMQKTDIAIQEYKQAVEKQPGCSAAPLPVVSMPELSDVSS